MTDAPHQPVPGPHAAAPACTRRQLLALPLAMATAAAARSATLSPALAPLPLPPVVDLSALFGPVKDQGTRMTCAYFAVTAAAEATLARRTGRVMALSEQYLTDIAHGGKALPDDETTDVVTVLKMVRDLGMVPATARPYQMLQKPGQMVLPPDAALLALGQQFRLRPRAMSMTDKFLEAMQRQLLRQPLVVALALPHDHAGWRDDGLVQPVPGLVPDDAKARQAFPNHFVALTGYDQRRQLFFFRNSWGPDWGRGGYGRISFASMLTRWWTHDALFFRDLPTP